MPTRPDQSQPPDDAGGHWAALGYRSEADRRSAADQSALADRPARWSREGLRQRLERLPGWHPSSPEGDAHEQRKQLGGVDVPRQRPEPLTDSEHADRVQHVRAQLADARKRRLATDERFFDPADNRWSSGQQVIRRSRRPHYASAPDVPCDRKAVMAGGLGGAGKSTVLENTLASTGRST